MARQLFWLSDEEWARIERYLPRGRRGTRQVDDRRVISGIIHMLKTGARWRDCPLECRPYTTIYNRFNRWSKQGVGEDVFYALSGSSGVVSTTAVASAHVKAHRSAAGKREGICARHRPVARRTHDQSSCHSRCRRPARGPYPNARADPRPGRRRRPAKTRSNPAQTDRRPRLRSRHPAHPTRKHPHTYDHPAYRSRNLIERMFCRLKDFRRIATRYDKRADTFVSAVCIAAIILWWLN